MISHKNITLAATLLSLLLILPGCGSAPTRPGEPSPKDDVSAIDEAATGDETAQAAEAGEGESAPAEDAEQAMAEPPAGSAEDDAAAAAEETPAEQPAQAQAAPPPPPAAPVLVPSDKPRIVAKVETVQFPAWVERAGVRAAIKASWAIYTGDRIITGGDGRVVLSVAGEGRMKVGGSTQVDMTPAYEATGGPEPPLLTLRRGSMTLTAPMVRSAVFGGTQINVREGIAATVMGGQVFAQADSNEDLLVLVDGFAQISGPKLNPGSMKTAGTYLRVPRVGRAQAVSPAGGERIARWLSQPELVRGRPALDAGGTWDVSLNSGYNLRQLETMACRIQNRGYPTEIYPVREPGKQVWYRVVVRRFKSKNDAVDFLGTAKALGAKEPWVLLPQS